MSPETHPEPRYEQDERDDPEQNERSAKGHRGTRSLATAAVVLVVAGGVAAFLFFPSAPDPRRERLGPAMGLACPHLRQAANANEQDDRAAFEREVAQAAEIAEGTLQKSGQAFGEPERIALELDLTGGGSGSVRTERLLRLALRACRALESA